LWKVTLTFFSVLPFGGEGKGLRKRGKKAAQKRSRKITDAGMNPVLDASALEPQKEQGTGGAEGHRWNEFVCVFQSSIKRKLLICDTYYRDCEIPAASGPIRERLMQNKRPA